jgi:uncharacterized membrane protein YhaH (DUF805 family)
MLVVFFFVVRAGPALLYRRLHDVRRAAAAGLLQATSLSIPMIVVRLGMQLHSIDAGTAAAIVTAGLITVLVFPPVALTLLSRAQADERKAST